MLGSIATTRSKHSYIKVRIQKVRDKKDIFTSSLRYIIISSFPSCLKRFFRKLKA